MSYALWIKDGPSSPRSTRHPSCAPTADKWSTVLDGHANGGVTRYATVADAERDAATMVPSDYIDFAVTPWRHDMAYHDDRPADAIRFDDGGRPYKLHRFKCDHDEGDMRLYLDEAAA